MQRKSELDAMLADSQRYEAKRQEVDAWLSRMEGRLARMAPVANTADVLEAQIKEQKSFHAELHQYKAQIDIFSQLTQRLIAVYQQDDTTKVKKTTELINQRYNDLNTSDHARWLWFRMGTYVNTAVNYTQDTLYASCESSLNLCVLNGGPVGGDDEPTWNFDEVPQGAVICIVSSYRT
ncbi:unnamed protein product [Nesidiocoris tenuis]|uniref:Uncharacterized protein n=1 Tax=Nesidiocoris tenuis TaxID=355587 RepID=A0A6H5GJP4_9HEMI|nr:unnamed protein product [Nesidiocoris tenuis]